MAVGAVTRALGQCTLEQKAPLTRDEAATKVQSVCRGYLSRVVSEKIRKDLRHAEKANGYKPESLEAIKRASLLCEKLGYNLLVHPKTRVYQGVEIVIYPPSLDIEFKEYIGIYLDNRELFTEAIKQLTRFLCDLAKTRSYVRNLLIKDTTCICFSFSEAESPFIDVLPLYLENGQGKIGLFRLSYRNFAKTEVECLQKVYQDLIHIFPYHAKEILKIVGECNCHGLFDQDKKNEILKRFKIAYEDHLAFIKAKGITFENPLQMVEVTSDRREALKNAVVLAINVLISSKDAEKKTSSSESRSLEAMVKDILNPNPIFDSKNWTENSPGHTVALFEESFPKILDLTTAFLSKLLKDSVESAKKGISSNSKFLTCRTLRFDGRHGFGAYSDLVKQVASELKEKEIFADEVILRSIFTNMQRHEIAFYSPSLGDREFASQYIFC